MAKQEGHGVFKEFKLTSLAVDNPTSVLVLVAIIIFAGLGAYLSIPRESAPEITVPNIIVTTIYPGVAPKDIETLVTRPIEDELNAISDVKTITSSSIEGYSSINIEFNAGVDMTEARQEVREKVDIAKPELPEAVEDPQIFEINISEFPVMQVNISGDYDLVRLRDVAEELQDRIEQIASVLEVTLAGGLEREVKVDVDLAKLKFYDLAFDDVINAIRDENVTVPGGTIDVGDVKYLVRVPGEFESTALIADIVIATREGNPIYVRDVAQVDFGFKERDSYARLDRTPVVTLGISKRSGENIIETSQAVQAVIAEMQPEFPPGTVVKITSDQSEEIREMVSSLENNIISGLILVIGVLLFVLGVRTASFVGIAIPLSMLMSFSIMQLIGFTLNMVVLFSLILALGMLVDNGIVVVENIYRFRERGYDRVTAAKLGTGEVAVPIIASTATTLAAFAPMAFWPGIIGEFMRYLPITLIITLSSSLFVALVINPVLCSLLLNTEDAKVAPLPPATRKALIGASALAVAVGLLVNWLSTLLLVATVVVVWFVYKRLLHPTGHWLMTQGLPALIRLYERQLRWALNHRLRMLGTAGASLIIAIFAFAALNAGVELFPEDIPPSVAFIQIEAPLGTRVEQTDDIVNRVESAVGSTMIPDDLESTVSTVGQSTSGGFGGGGRGTHLATVAVNFIDIQERAGDASQQIESTRQQLEREVAGAEVNVDMIEMGPPTGLPVTIEVSGEDPDMLKELGDQIVSILENSPVYSRLDGLESDMADGRPELVVDIDREKAALYGLNTRDIGFTVRSAINGTEASKFRDGKDEYDITVRLAEEYRNNLNAIGDLTVVSDMGQQIPLSSVAVWSVNEGFGGINRKDLKKVVTVASDVRQGYNAIAVLEEVKLELAQFAASLPTGYRLEYAGQMQDQQESQAFLTGAFVTAVFLIAFILVTQFDSVTKPLIILSSVLLSTIGVLIGLIVFRMPFGIIMTGVGVISLAGVVVNNAIVLIDYIDTLRKRDGLSRLEALIRGGMTRFRPVILTAVTTVLGLVPLAIGLNFDFFGLYASLNPDPYWGGEQAAWWGPMAIAVIAGLTFATFLTLILVPVMYSLLDDLDDFLARHFKSDREPEEDEDSIVERELEESLTGEHRIPEPIRI
ncbi:MAG: efflux RND transporter permease subunit [Gemmatimonadota bacterium]|nr:MAG: efflux RND transporter permease subunit [Gemmatimonadota bacterium]